MGQMIGFPKTKLKKHRTETVNAITYKIVDLRDKHKCQLCGKEYELQLHHICGRGKNLTNNVDNCIMLCDYCHNQVVHKNNKKYRPILQEIVKNKCNE